MDRARPQGHVAVPPARISFRSEAWRRIHRGGRRRQHLPRPECGHRGHVDGPLPPEGGRRHRSSGGRAAALLGERLLPSGLRRGVRAARPDGALPRSPGSILPDELRDGSRRGRDQARPVRHGQAVPDRHVPVVPRTLDGKRHADGLEGEVPHQLRTDAAQRVPHVLRRLRVPRRGGVQAARFADRGRRDRRGVVARRGRLRPAARRLVHVSARALRPARDPAGLRRGPKRHGPQRQDVGDRARGC